MSEDFPIQLKQAYDIYELLTARPDPEQEEKAQKDLLQLFGTMKEIMASDLDVAPILNEIHAKISKWDTLERWFNEEKELKTAMENLFIKFELGTPATASQTVAAPTAISEENASEIPTINAPNEVAEQKNVPKLSTPTFKSRLAPPVFKIPSVMAPKKKITPSTIQQESSPEVTPTEESTPDQPINSNSAEISSETPTMEETPKVKFNFPAKNITPIKINPIKIDVGSQKKTEPEIRPVAAPSIRPVMGGATTGGPSIRPVNIQAAPSTNAPMIKPVSAGGPQIKPVSMTPVTSSPSSPMIKPVSAGGPQIKPVSMTPLTSSPSTPMIKPVSSGGFQMKPVGELQKPMIKAMGASNVGMQPVSPPNSQQHMGTPVPTGGPRPVNLFDTSAKKPVNLFDQGIRKVSDNTDSGFAQEGNATNGLSKVSALDKFDFAAQNTGPVTSEEDEELLRMSKEEMYQELLRLEAKRHYTDKLMNEVNQRYQKQQINEAEYRGSKERFAFEVDNLMKKINKIRNLVLGIK